MKKSQIDAVTLLAAMIAGGLSLTLLQGPFVWLSSIAGLILFVVILSYDREGYRSGFQSFAFSAVCGFTLMLAAAGGLRVLAVREAAPSPIQTYAVEWLPLAWICATFIFWAIDRSRMSSRQLLEDQYGARPRLAERSVFPSLTASAPTYVTETPAAQASSAAAATSFGTPAPPSPVAQPEPSLAPQSPPAPAPQPASSPVTQAPPIPVAQPTPIPVKPLKEAMVYVGLVGEGLNVMRSVKAEHLGRDFYRIVEPMPTDEKWEFQPGQVVRCQKRKLSSGKALVAIEEAPRTT